MQGSELSQQSPIIKIDDYLGGFHLVILNLLTICNFRVPNCLIFLRKMETHIIHCGYLNVRAEEMIKPLPVEQVRTFYMIDNQGCMQISMNALLIIEDLQMVLIDPGCADFLPSRVIKDYGLEIPVSIEQQIAKVGYHSEQITDVVFTHLHFDHGSGAFLRVPGNIVKRFPDAKYHVLKEHYEYAASPGLKEPNSLFTTFLNRIDQIHWLEDWERDWIEYRVYNGHTKGMVVPVLNTPGGDTCFVSDLIPMEIFLKPEVSSGYDLDPGLAMEEKADFLSELSASVRIVYFHDPLKDSGIYP